MRKIAVAVLIGFILLDIIPATLGLSLGVKSGDWIVYDFQQSLGSEQNQKVEFLSVLGTVVTMRVTDSSLTGVEVSGQNETIDLAADEVSPQEVSFLSTRVYLIPAGLSKGDFAYLGNQIGNRTILSETTVTYAGAIRTVIYANFSLQGNQYTLYWDKQTGVLAQATMSSGIFFKALLAVDTNMWTGGIGWWPWAIIAIAVALGIITSNKHITRRLSRLFHPQLTDETTTKKLTNPHEHAAGKDYVHQPSD
jgi:hypothetical protein